MSDYSSRRASLGPVVEGEDTWSESAMVLYFDDALRNGLSLRISRFPESNCGEVDR